MKNEKAFLNGMWYIVEQEEKLEIEKNIARKKNHELIKKNIFVVLSIILTFILLLVGLCVSKYLKESIYIILSIPLLLGYMLDKNENTFERDKKNGE